MPIIDHHLAQRSQSEIGIRLVGRVVVDPIVVTTGGPPRVKLYPDILVPITKQDSPATLCRATLFNPQAIVVDRELASDPWYRRNAIVGHQILAHSCREIV